MSRLFARSQDGQRAIGSVPGNKGKNISLIGALNMDGILAAMTVEGSTNTEVFLTPSLTKGDLSLIKKNQGTTELFALPVWMWIPKFSLSFPDTINQLNFEH
ncbi:hypothetical protein CEP07_17785 [Cylindrospermopsis raciborskii S01]|nr:hypothetical protein CEP07_17785 [Cylindrospermopsis raciborskii S01]